MRNTLTVGGLVALMAWTLSPALAAEDAKKPAPTMAAEQQAEMEAYVKAGTPGAPHQGLAAEAGTYDAVVKTWHEPGGPVHEEKGTATRSMVLAGRAMVEDFQGTMMGEAFTGHGMTGFDNVTGKYWSTWIDSMSTGLMVSEGSCDAKKACTFKGSWNDPVSKGPKHVRTASRWTDPTTQVFEMYGPGRAGKEMKMMEITYRKK